MKAPASTASETSRNAKVRPPSNDLLTWSSSMSGAVAIGKDLRGHCGVQAQGRPRNPGSLSAEDLVIASPIRVRESLNWVSISNSRAGVVLHTRSSA
jgi:hypothetical protein